MPETRATELPPKLYFRIGEVATLVGVEPHVLRYWEREFRAIRPRKSARGQRVYSRRDVENLMRVRDLLYREGFTIAGARKKLERRASAEPGPNDAADAPAANAASADDAAAPDGRVANAASPDDAAAPGGRPANAASPDDAAAPGGRPANAASPDAAGTVAPLPSAGAGAANALATAREELFAIARDIDAFLAELDAAET